MTKPLLAIGALAALSLAACDRPQSHPTAVPVVTVAAETAPPQQPSVPQAPSSEPLASPSKLPPCVTDRSAPEYPLLCKKAPDFTLARVTGTGPISLAEARGRIVILDFCATFMMPCSKALPAHQAITKEHPGQIAFMVLMIDEPDSLDSQDALKSYVTTLKVSSPVLWDSHHKAAEAYSLHLLSLPGTMLIDQEGIVRAAYAGYHDQDDELMKKEIKKLL